MNHVTTGGGTKEQETATRAAQYGGVAVFVTRPLQIHKFQNEKRRHGVAEKHQEMPDSHKKKEMG